MISILTLLVLGIASFRITRALLFDTWIEGTREQFYIWLVNRTRLQFVFNKVADGCSCSWCTGWWVSLAMLSLYLRAYPWQLGVNGWISAFAVAGIQGFIHALEPEDG